MQLSIPRMHETRFGLDDIALFVEVASTQSFARAAARLELPPSTLSRRVAAMERRLGVRLLQRTTRSVTLTPLAKPYFAACLDVLAAAERARATIENSKEKPGRIRISMPVDLGVEVLGPIIASYAAQRPGLRIDFDLSSSAADLLRDPVDLVFRIGRTLDDRVVARKIGSIASGIYASPAFIAGSVPIRQASQLEQLACLNLQTANGPMAWSIGAQRWPAAPGPSGISANSVGLLRTLAERGLGVALLPRHLAVHSTNKGSLVRLLADESTPHWPLYAMTATRTVANGIRDLISFVTNELAATELAEVAELPPR